MLSIKLLTQICASLLLVQIMEINSASVSRVRIIRDASAIDIIPRKDWNARAPRKRTNLSELPAPFVIIHHSATPACETEDRCKKAVKGFQDYHMDTKHWDDIAYNFLVGEDGNIYEGRGWGLTGAHAGPKYNPKSIGICMIGTFASRIPNQAALNALQNLINYGTTIGQITSDYKLIGHRQVMSTDCPGDSFYDALKQWDHWTPNP